MGRVQSALQTLPGVEKDSIKVNNTTKLASFKVTDPKTFKLDDAYTKVAEIGSKYKATLIKAGSAIETQ